MKSLDCGLRRVANIYIYRTDSEVEKACCEAWGVDFDDFELHGIPSNIGVYSHLFLFGYIYIYITIYIYIYIATRRKPQSKLFHQAQSLLLSRLLGRLHADQVDERLSLGRVSSQNDPKSGPRAPQKLSTKQSRSTKIRQSRF